MKSLSIYLVCICFEDVVGDDDEDENGDTRRHWQHQSHGNRGHGSHHHGDRHGSYHHGDSKVTFLILSNSRDNITKAKSKLDEVLDSECSRTTIDISKHALAEKQVR